MSSYASPRSVVATLVAAAAVGFGGGAFAGNSISDAGTPTTVATTPAPTPTESATPASTITLTADQSSVAASERIDMSGRLQPPVAGVELTVERSLNGSEWATFPDSDDPVTVTTDDNGEFRTYVQTSRSGENQFRVVGQVGDAFLESEPVVVTIS
ncbi:MAG TPA: hypothetical protein VJ644_04030 [Jiangellaceae bacterium]|nr:hypothetical protein [Jiangellaceae bacterium]